ncbi:MAG: cyclopropane-fatty-acyl-phospholipid synthase family protein [Thiohalomonadales bacterium]|nr:cyclopropane-fatty-acyl-phospholipid synthase family protein [Thiohalomonadales bacterium]
MNRLNQNLALDLTESGLLPDSIIRHGIRRLLRQRLQEIHAANPERMADDKHAFIQHMQEAAIALQPHKANEQHYEVPAEFYLHTLGPNLKYSCCYWPSDAMSLAEAEKAGLEITCQHAGIVDGMRILELGCGWGSLSLWMARHYPNSHITAVSNSHSQREFILQHARKSGLHNLEVITSDVNDFDTDDQFDRIVSVEMFEHMRNYQNLFHRISNWLLPDGEFFMHIFVHRDTPYAFVDNGPSDWMSRHFFSGGMMPSDDLPLHFQDHLKLQHHWRWSGTHYEKTANAWLAKMDEHKDQIWPTFEKTYGHDFAHKWWMRWRIFFMACAELFGYDNGQHWFVSHYRFSKRNSQ